MQIDIGHFMFSDDAHLVRTPFLVFLFALDFKTFFHDYLQQSFHGFLRQVVTRTDYGKCPHVLSIIRRVIKFGVFISVMNALDFRKLQH